MASVNTNAAAITALRTLQNTNHSMDATQNRISTGYKIGEAKDNAAYWAISTTLKSDNKSLSTVKDALGLGASTVDTAYQGLNKAKDVLDEIKSKLTAATQDGVDRDTIQNEIKQLQDQLKSIATSSVFSGENWLSTDTSAMSYNANKQVVASFSRDPSGAVNIGTIGVDISKVALFDASTAAGTGGIVDGAINLKGKDGRDLAIGGTDVTTGNQSKAGLDAAATNVTTGSATAAGGNNTSVIGAAVAANTLNGTSAVTGGHGSTVDSAAKEAFTGTFAGTTFDANDKLTLVYAAETGGNQTVVIDKAAASAAGIATPGTIASVDDLVLAVNSALTTAGQTGVKAYKDTSGALALQRWDNGASAALVGSSHSVDIVSLTGTDPVLASPVTVGASSSPQTGNAGSVAVKTLQVSAPTGNGPATFSLDGTHTVSFGSGLTNASSANDVALAIKTAIEGDTAPGGLNSLVTVSVLSDTVTLTYRNPAQVTANPSISITGGTGITSTGGSTSNGTNPVKASAQSALTGFSAVTLDADDQLTFSFVDSVGGTTRNIAITAANVQAANTAAGNSDGTKIGSAAIFADALSRALTATTFASSYNITYNSGAGPLKVEAATATAGQTITINTTVGLTDTDSTASKGTALQMGLSAPAGAATFGTSVGPATPGTTATTLVGGTAGTLTLEAGDKITVNYMMNGTAGSRTLTVASAGAFAAADFATAWAAGTSVPAGSVPTVSNSSGTLTFSSSTPGALSSFTLVDATVNSSAATGGRIKNLDVLAGLTSSKAASVKTAALTWTGLGATDKVTLNLAADGQAVAPVTVAAGTSVDDFVANLNADTTFNTKLVASKTTGGELLLTSKTTGAASAASLTSVAFADTNGAAKNVTGTGFGSVVSAGTAATAAFTSAVTLDDDDNLYFNIQVDGATAPTNVTINKALVNKALTAAAQLANPSAAAVTSGTIATAADFKTVVDAALAQANVKGVTTATNATNQLVFTSSSVGANSKVAVSSVSASQGGDKISLENIDISATGLAKVGATTSDQIKQVLSAYIDAVNTAITKVTSAAASLGSVASRIDLQKSFVDTLMDTIDKGVGNLIDADMSEESTKLQALQVKQQLGVQALSIANQASQSILSLFRS